MSNWYYCNLTVQGTSDEMEKFYSKIRTENEVKFKMNSFFPLPDLISENEKKTKNNETTTDIWYRTNWGCYHDVDVIYNQIVEPEYYRLKYECRSYTNLNFILILVNLFPNLYIKYDFNNPEIFDAKTYEFKGSLINYYSNDILAINIETIGEKQYTFVDEDSVSNNLTYCIDIVGEDFGLSLNDEGFNKDNVDNWDDLEDYLFNCNPFD